MTIHAILILASFIIFLIAAFAVFATDRVNLIALGLALFALAFIVAGCSGTNGVHGKVTGGVTGNISDPTNSQYNVGGEVDFLKKRHNGSGK